MSPPGVPVQYPNQHTRILCTANLIRMSLKCEKCLIDIWVLIPLSPPPGIR